MIEAEEQEGKDAAVEQAEDRQYPELEEMSEQMCQVRISGIRSRESKDREVEMALEVRF